MVGKGIGCVCVWPLGGRRKEVSDSPAFASQKVEEVSFGHSNSFAYTV